MAADGPSTRAITRVFLTIAALAGGLYLLWLVRSVVGLVAISGFLALSLGPGVDFFCRRGIPRAGSILLVYLSIALSIFGIGLLIVPPIVTQVQGLSSDIPGYLTDIRKNKTFRKYDEKYSITKKLNEQAKKLPQRLGDAAGALESVTVGVFSAVLKLVTVLTITFFLLLDGGRLPGVAARMLGGGKLAERYLRIADDIYRAVSGYVLGNLIISFIAGIVAYATMSILGVPFAVPLAVLMAFLDLIPLVGATIGGTTIALVTLFNDFPTSTIVWLVVFIVYQQIENNLLQPVVYRRTVDVAPLFTIVSILVGAALLGVLGALVAIPIAAAVQIIARDLWEGREGRPLVELGDEDSDDDGGDAPPGPSPAPQPEPA